MIVSVPDFCIDIRTSGPSNNPSFTDEKISDVGKAMKADKERNDAKGRRGRRRISVGAIIAATIAMVLSSQSETNFKKRSAYAKPTETYVPQDLSLRRVMCTPAACRGLAMKARIGKGMSCISPLARHGMTTAA